LAGIAVAAVSITMASSLVPGTRVEVQDWDCPPAPASCARTVVAVGFPIPYIADYHGISPVGSADLIGALIGVDKIRPLAFWTNVAFYGALVAVVWGILTRRVGRSTP
jgi:hypothetical protein